MQRFLIPILAVAGLVAFAFYVLSPPADPPLHEKSCSQILEYDFSAGVENDPLEATAYMDQYASKGCSPDTLAEQLGGERIEVCMTLLGLEEVLDSVISSGLMTSVELEEAQYTKTFMIATQNALSCTDF